MYLYSGFTFLGFNQFEVKKKIKSLGWGINMIKTKLTLIHSKTFKIQLKLKHHN